MSKDIFAKILIVIGSLFISIFFFIKMINIEQTEIKKRDKIFISKNIYFKDNNKIKKLLTENKAKLICDKNPDPLLSKEDFFKKTNIKYEDLYFLYHSLSCKDFLKNSFFKKELNKNIYKESKKFLIKDLLNGNYSNSYLMLQISENVFLKQFLSIDFSNENKEYKILDPYLILNIGEDYFNGEEYREIFNKYISEKIKENDEYNKKYSKEPLFLLKDSNYLNEILNNKANIILKK